MASMPVTLSDRAARRIAEILKAEPQPTALRLAVMMARASTNVGSSR